ncbi:RING-type zinc-finger, LisH dimerization motif protein (macronuclear) [Tetrahymena thermophila SB210]|uniref:RING-type zinc-finger, LisH dimerization motif protein n=1 Tax=Tetrahymena thermophila (strain SB210) TaxID=312017 RepID=I7M1F7_TETTS|nr:RING-type zinc-finger, LisH dimerization motif protein [Tetrahymena thermophila SB210]EAR96264.3 RING-type zinc-finger, LisH dimerization motif protein [Tetrahymena thermophila SB210]|eukprot:XP_001016509.3 RING-type zinc-finger, LisH dimerization motif protein [Tetrahymena thermophila SB210]
MNENQLGDLSYQNMKFLNEENISKFLHCPICKKIFNNPKRLLLCGDTFCEKCLQVNDSKKKGDVKKCFACGQTYNQQQIQDDLIPKKIIEDIKVQCTRTKDCQWVGILQEHKIHIQNNECVEQPEQEKKQSE